ncbi:MAG: hypothetical protein AABZ32_06220, partial [Bacteroidota bacterium]
MFTLDSISFFNFSNSLIVNLTAYEIIVFTNGNESNFNYIILKDINNSIENIWSQGSIIQKIRFANSILTNSSFGMFINWVDYSIYNLLEFTNSNFSNIFSSNAYFLRTVIG